MHTKGPWRIGPVFDETFVLITSDDGFICRTVGGNDQANAHLIKEAPALLDVVKDCVNFLADLNTTAFDAADMVLRAKALHKRAYTAHSKARETQ